MLEIVADRRLSEEHAMGIVGTLAAVAGIVCASYAAYVAFTWLRDGRPKRGRPSGVDSLLDRFVPEYDVREQHEIAVAAPPDVTLAAAKEMELEGPRIIRAIFWAREVIMRSTRDARRRPRGLVEDMKAIGWGMLGEAPEREVVMGAVTKPWEANPVFRSLPPEDFTAFTEPEHVKIAWTLSARSAPDGGSIFRTETRAVAIGPLARKKFRVYWSLLSPGIILIRWVIARALKKAAERRWRLEGDDVVGDARAQLTHAVTIDAPPSDVWPWLLQMGCQRAGWYSWDVLDNAGVRSAERIIPELQRLTIGDILPARPVGAEGFKVLRIVPERALVLSGVSPQWAGTWAFVLQPLGAGRTRLVTRYRAAYPPSPRMSILVPVLATVHAFMERKQLRTIKHHAEQMHAA